MYIESDMEKMRELLDVLKDLGLDLNWIIAVAALSAQEIAIKRKLDELGEPYGERDFQKLANNLTNAMKTKEGLHLYFCLFQDHTDISGQNSYIHPTNLK